MTDLFGKVISKANSELFLFLILLILCLIMLLRPMYKQITDAKLAKQKQDFEQTKQVLEVIKGNTAIISDLKRLLEDSKVQCSDCRQVQRTHFISMETKQDEIIVLLTAVKQRISDS